MFRKRQLLKKIRKEFPQLQWKVAKHNVEGWDHYILILEDKYVFRFPRADKSYFKKFYNEIQLHEYLKTKVNLPIPEYTFIAKDKSFAGYRMIAGQQLTLDKFTQLPPQTKHAIARQIANFLTILHKTPRPTAKKFTYNDKSSQKLYKELLIKVPKLLFPKVTKKDRLRIEAFLEEYKNYLQFPNKVLIHNDFYHSHILLDQNKKSLSGILDFTDRVYDDPARDFTELWIYGQQFVEEIYKLYRGPKDKDFLKRSSLYNKRLALWNMMSPLEGGQGNFKKTYKIFKEIFK